MGFNIWLEVRSGLDKRQDFVDLTEIEVHLLMQVAAWAPDPVRETFVSNARLARCMRCDERNLKRVTDRVVNKGFLRKRSAGPDRRFLYVVPTTEWPLKPAVEENAEVELSLDDVWLPATPSVVCSPKGVVETPGGGVADSPLPEWLTAPITKVTNQEETKNNNQDLTTAPTAPELSVIGGGSGDRGQPERIPEPVIFRVTQETVDLADYMQQQFRESGLTQVGPAPEAFLQDIERRASQGESQSAMRLAVDAYMARPDRWASGCPWTDFISPGTQAWIEDTFFSAEDPTECHTWTEPWAAGLSERRRRVAARS